MNANVNPQEIAKFGALASRWWDPNGPQRPLHELNPARLDYVCRHRALRGLRVLDVGCGAGLLTEAMAGEGARVTGIDLSPELIDVAQLHMLESGRQAEYRVVSAEELAVERPGTYDVVTCMEMLDHVPDPASVLRACFALLAPGGIMIVATLNRTLKALALAKIGAEYVLRWIPAGTHDWKQFLTPQELRSFLEGHPFDIEGPFGVSYNPLAGKWVRSSDAEVNYMMTVTRPAK